MTSTPRRSWGRAAKASPPPSVSPADAWEAMGAIKGERDWNEPTTRQKREGKTSANLDPCMCRCQCGGRGPGGQCALCHDGIHHVCGPHCRRYNPTALPGGFSTPYLPERRACGGGSGAG